MDLRSSIGLVGEANGSAAPGMRQRLRRHVNLQLVASGLPAAGQNDAEFSDIVTGVLDSFHEKAKLLSQHRCPADQRIEGYLRDHFADLNLATPLKLPDHTLVLQQHGIARELSLPADGDEHKTELLSSYRVRNGVLHNPRSDRRTTAGTFHVAEGGLPVPGDKKAVPREVFSELFRRAVQAPADLLLLPF